MTTHPSPQLSAFADLGLVPALTDALAAMGYEQPTPIQREAIPVILSGVDVVGQAATGTGKTAAFALPILQQLQASEANGSPVALVLVPTRELANQVCEAFGSFGRHLEARVLAVFGGQPIGHQLRELRQGVDVVVATPGRAIDLLDRGALRLDGIATVVLDEADEMLDMGFAEDIERLLRATSDGRQTILFSATMPPRIDAIARQHLTSPQLVKVEREPVAEGAEPLVEQRAYVVLRAHKAAAIARIISLEAPEAAVVFCRTRGQVDHLTDLLNGRGFRAEALHGGMDQEQRDRVMGRLRNGIAHLLVATDVAARGIDIDRLTHVVNYDVPTSPETYVHRIGRVGRAGRQGVAITLVEPREERTLRTIERVTRHRIAIEPVPTPQELEARKLERLGQRVATTVADGPRQQLRALAERLVATADPIDVVAAALQALHQAESAAQTDDDDVAMVSFDRGRRDRDGHSRRQAFDPDARRQRPASGSTGRVFIGLGRQGGLRPQDLVGAIANESSLKGSDIGSIQIFDRFALVEVPAGAVDEVISSLRRTTVKGKKVNARRERYERN